MADLDRLVEELVGQPGVRDAMRVDRCEQAHDQDEEEHASEEERHLVAAQAAPGEPPRADTGRNLAVQALCLESDLTRESGAWR